MTAFAREEAQSELGNIVWELRSVNSRYLDVYPRLPEDLRSLEPAVRERVGSRLRRGKVECALRYKAAVPQEAAFTINRVLANQVAKATAEIETLLSSPAPVHALDILRWPGVIETPTSDLEVIGKLVLEVLDAALGELTATRVREGKKISHLVLQRCGEMEPIIGEVRSRLPTILSTARERLAARLSELKEALDPARIEQELVLFAQKIDVAEELDRLDAHITEVRRVLTETKPAGRRLDFLMQEMNREANTLGSKSADTDITRASVELKVLIEQIREQVQNVE